MLVPQCPNGLRDLHGQGHGPSLGQRAFLRYQPVQRLALDVFHGEVEMPVLFPHIEALNDVGMT